MTGEIDPAKDRLITALSEWSGLPPRDRLLKVLSEWSGLPPSEHNEDAAFIFAVCVLQIEKPKKFRERAERIYKAADEINLAMSAMHPMERWN